MATAAPFGRRVVVTGLAGSGKSTVSKRLAATTGLPVVHLDLEFWEPGWVAPADGVWAAKQRQVLAGDAWIADGNYTDTLALRLARADTVIVLAMPWPLCAARAVRRSITASTGEMPHGCADSAWRRLRDESGVAWRTWRKRQSEPHRERELIAEHGQHATVHILRSRREVNQFLSALGSAQHIDE